MTTIAWDGKTLATDSQGTSGENKCWEPVKKLWRNVGPFQAVAFSGEVRSFQRVIKAFRAGEYEPHEVEGVEVAAVCIDKAGKAWAFDGHHWSFEKMAPKTAHGSGWALATAAMAGGADAADAVKIACRLALCSGGRIQKFTVK